MKLLASTSRRVAAATALASAALLLPVAALAGPTGTTAAGRTTAAASVPACGQLEVWLGLGNGSAGAGSVRYPLEFSNTSDRACRLHGFPRVVALNSHDRRLGKTASHFGRPRTVVLRPGATAHALLVISEVQVSPSCGMARAHGLRVTPPGGGATPIDGFSFATCTKTRIMSVGPVRPHIGIPAFTTG